MSESKTPSFDAAHVVEDSGGDGGGDPGAAAPAAVAEAPEPAPQGGGGQPRAPDGKFAPKNADGSDKSQAQIEAEGDGNRQPRVDTVPYSALLKERAEVKRLKEAERANEERLTRLATRLDMMQEGWQPQQQQKQPEPADDLGPDPEQDPIGSAKWLREQRAADIRARKEWQAQQSQQSTAQQAQQREWETFQNDLAASNEVWSETLAQVPEMNEVLEGLRTSFRREIKNASPGLVGQQLDAKVMEMESRHAVNAHRLGRHVGEYFAALAQSRNVPFPQRRQAQAQNGSGQPQPAPQAQPQPAAPDPAAANIKQLAAAQAASQTLSGTGGSPGTGKIDLAALDRMDDDELRQFIRSKNDRDPGGFERWKKTQMVGA